MVEERWIERCSGEFQVEWSLLEKRSIPEWLGNSSLLFSTSCPRSTQGSLAGSSHEGHRHASVLSRLTCANRACRVSEVQQGQPKPGVWARQSVDSKMQCARHDFCSIHHKTLTWHYMCTRRIFIGADLMPVGSARMMLFTETLEDSVTVQCFSSEVWVWRAGPVALVRLTNISEDQSPCSTAD